MAQKTPQNRVLFRHSSRLLGLGLFLILATVVGIVIAPWQQAHAVTSPYLNFQARLMTASGAIVPDGNYNVEFKLYTTATVTGTPDQGACTYNGGTSDPACQWTETRTGGNVVQVKNGYLTVNLGSVTALPNIDYSQQLWLTMRVGGTGAPTWDPEMNPRLQLTAVPYAFKAGDSATLGGIASSGFIQNTTTLQTANIAIQSSAVGNIAALIQGASGQTANILQVKGNGVATPYLSVSSAGAVQLQPSTDTTSVFNIKTSVGNNQFTIDTLNNRVGIGLGSNFTPTLTNAGLEIKGALRLSGTGSPYLDTFVTPLGTSLNTRISAPVFNIGSAEQFIALGLTSTANVTARGIALFDARTVAHSPTLSVISPDETKNFGLSYDGSNVIGYLKNGASTVTLQGNALDILTAQNASGVARVGIGNTGPSYPLDVTGDINSTTALRVGGTQVCTSTGCISTLQSAYNGSTGGTTPEVKIDATRSGVDIQDSDAGLGGGNNLLSLRGSNAAGLGAVKVGFGVNGNIFVKPTTDSTTEFQLQKSGGTNLFVIDSTNGRVGINQGASVVPTATLDITGAAGGSTNGIRLQTAAATNRGLVVQGTTAQTANLVELQDVTGAMINRADATGNVELAGYTNTPFAGVGIYGNLLTYSEQFDNAAWAKTNVTAPTANSASAPDNQTTAESLADSASGGSVSQTSGTAPTNNTYTFSVWLKTATTQNADLRIDGATSGTGTAVTVPVTATWQRFSVSQNTNGFTGNIAVNIFPGTTAGSGTVQAWGAQLVRSSNPLVYIRTIASTVATNSGLVSNGNGLFRGYANSTTAFDVQNSAGTSLFTIDSTNSLLNLGTTGNNLQVNASGTGVTATINQAQTADALQVNATGTTGTQTNGILFTRNNTGGTTTNGVNITNAAGGTLNNGLSFAGTIGTDINRASGTLSLAGAGGVSITSSAGNIVLGTADATTTLLVLDNSSVGSDPTGTDGAMYYNTSMKQFRCYGSGAWTGCGGGTLSTSTTASGDVASCTTACTALGVNGVLPANYCQAGRVVHLLADGLYQTAGSNFQFDIYFGTSTTKASDTLLSGANNNGPAVIPNTSSTSYGWHLDANIICNSATSITTSGTVSIANGAGTSGVIIYNPTTVTGLTTTTAKNLYIFPAYSVNAATTYSNIQTLVTTGM